MDPLLHPNFAVCGAPGRSLSNCYDDRPQFLFRHVPCQSLFSGNDFRNHSGAVVTLSARVSGHSTGLCFLVCGFTTRTVGALTKCVVSFDSVILPLRRHSVGRMVPKDISLGRAMDVQPACLAVSVFHGSGFREQTDGLGASQKQIRARWGRTICRERGDFPGERRNSHLVSRNSEFPYVRAADRKIGLKLDAAGKLRGARDRSGEAFESWF